VAEGAQRIRELAEAVDAKSGVMVIAANGGTGALPRTFPFTLARPVAAGILLVSFAAFPSSTGLMVVSVDIDTTTICGSQIEVPAAAGVHYALPLAAGAVTGLAAGAHNLIVKSAATSPVVANMAANDRVTAVLFKVPSTSLLAEMDELLAAAVDELLE